MTEFLVKKFIKNYDQTEQPEIRTAYGLLAGVVGICCNLLLFAVKTAIGFITGSISVMADAFNNLSDAASSIVGFVGVKMAQKPADGNHPFGHGRIEYIAAFIVAFIVIEVGVSLLKTSVGKLLHPQELTFGMVPVIILVLSVAVKLWMALFNGKLGKRVHSKVMTATAADSLGDVAATSATILSMIVFRIWHVNIDGLVGVVVSVLVMIAGFNIAKDTLKPLIGEPIDPEMYQRIMDFVNNYEGIMGSHDLIVHNYGPGRSMASIHAEVPSDVDIEVSHEIVDRIEREAAKELGIFLVIHMDPVEVKDIRVRRLRQMTEEILMNLDERLTMHDFRIAESEHCVNLIFDLVVPRDYTEQMQKDCKEAVCQLLKERDERYCGMITAECTYCMER
ncbi:MAG: cation transporter [Lachnospiraceae bacterium]|nr:cation transporter [Lachnospiraceae bacterium]MCI9284107.1 cation transporter [Lachnospiraceae bacterium]